MSHKEQIMVCELSKHILEVGTNNLNFHRMLFIF